MVIAACKKWIDFTDKRAAMVIARDGFAKWGRASRSALKSGIFVRSGMPIPDDAIATIGAHERGFVSETTVPRPAGVWSFGRVSEPVRELAKVSETARAAHEFFNHDVFQEQFRDKGNAGSRYAPKRP